MSDVNRRDGLAKTLLKPINPAFTVVLGGYTLMWGLWLIAPWFSTFASSPIFSVMASLAHESVWGGIAVAAGFIIIRGAIKPVYWNIEIGALVSFFFWLIICILYLYGEWHSTAGLSAAAFAIYSCLIWVNVRVNRRHFTLPEH